MRRLISIILSIVGCASLYSAHDKDVRYDEICYLTSHNSYAAVEHGYLYAQQALSIEKQLHIGVRGLMLDIAQEREDILLVHHSPFVSRILCGGKQPALLASALATIAQFLKEHPREIITIFLENYVPAAAPLDALFASSPCNDYILTEKHWDPEGGWPTLDWMRTKNKRLVIFNSKGATNVCFHEWHHVVENQWGTLHPARACRERPESRACKDKKRQLYLLNYFPTLKFRSDNGYQKINTEHLDTFLQRVLTKGLDTGSEPQKLPTFLCLDFVDVGNGIAQVARINEMRQQARLTQRPST